MCAGSFIDQLVAYLTIIFIWFKCHLVWIMCHYYLKQDS